MQLTILYFLIYRIMKRIFLLAIFCLMFIVANAQDNTVAFANEDSISINDSEQEDFQNYQIISEELATTLRRLNVWKKITRIYGWTSIGLGTICLINGLQNDSRYNLTAYYDKAEDITAGSIMIAQGTASVIVSSRLNARRNRILNENNLIGSIPIVQKEITFDEKISQTELEASLRRLNIWSKINTIYGWTSIGVGALFIYAGLRGNDNNDPEYEELDESIIGVPLGIVAIGEGIACVIVGSKLKAKRERLMRESNLVGSTPLIGKEMKFDNISITPSVNLMSYRNNPVHGVGAGFSITF